MQNAVTNWKWSIQRNPIAIQTIEPASLHVSNRHFHIFPNERKPIHLHTPDGQLSLSFRSVTIIPDAIDLIFPVDLKLNPLQTEQGTTMTTTTDRLCDFPGNLNRATFHRKRNCQSSSYRIPGQDGAHTLAHSHSHSNVTTDNGSFVGCYPENMWSQMTSSSSYSSFSARAELTNPN